MAKVFTSTELLNPDIIEETIDKLIKFMFPTEIIEELQKEENSKEKLLEIYFLKQEEKKHLIKNPKDGEYNCNLIYCTRLVAKKENDENLYEQATDLFLKNNCKARYEITIEGHQDNYDFLELLDILK